MHHGTSGSGKLKGESFKQVTRSSSKAKMVSGFITLALLCTTILGCSNNANNNAAGSGSSPDASAEGANKYDGVKLTHISMSGSNRPEAYKEFAKAFKEETGAEVEIIDAPWDQLHDKIINDIISQSGSYDVMDVDSGWDGEMASQFELLDPYIEKNKMDMSDLLPIFAKAVGVSSITSGKRYGLPVTGSGIALFYNKEILEKLNLQPPATWDDLLAMLPKLKEGGVTPFTSAGVNIQLPKMFYAAYAPQGKPLFDKDFNPLFNGPEGIEAINRLKTLYSYAPKGYLSMDNPDANVPFMNGEAAIQIAWPLFILKELDDPNKSKIVGKWGVTVAPGPGNIAPWYTAISKLSKNKDAAFEWMQFIQSSENAKKLMLDYNNYSVWNSIWSDEEVKSKVPAAEVVKEANNASFFPTFFQHPKGIEWFSNSGGFLSAAIFGQTTPEAALKQMEDDWNKLKANSKIPEGLIYEELSAE
ncbi:ABC transporter substrate-binding protein [Paenibacillus nasutitermitis]|uniref:ABC transporter substrate-binding protein n=1 Tax=Paenibacillus nasutitermitis TaxID=1652958 RepID=A0A916ZI66_9BACL|nr:sugar ABC transporter substrate-binding protein [Paenibacillus nasutitermitis]GGD99151.1 hypothetical protein GCM10010911_67540 [Paenibacillus nasutitermitis]